LCIKELEMSLPQQIFVNVSGIDANADASMVFVWSNKKGAEDHVLVGSGHIVNVPAHARPPGIQAGQFSVTFLLPPGCSADDVFVTDDKNGDERLTGVRVIARLSQARYQREEGGVSVADDALPRHRISPAFRSSATLNGGN
jgi:hypothetical protein